MLEEKHFVTIFLIKLNNNKFPMFKMVGILFEVMLRYSTLSERLLAMPG